MVLPLKVPNYSQICRRAQLLGQEMKRLTKRRITDLVIDSTGLKVATTSDHEIYPDFLNRSPRTVKRTYGDGAYDRQKCYEANFKHGSSPIIPPQKNARYRKDRQEHLEARNKAILEIRGLGGDNNARKLWKIMKGYHRRSLAETGMYRFKALFGGVLRSRTFEGQQSEASS